MPKPYDLKKPKLRLLLILTIIMTAVIVAAVAFTPNVVAGSFEKTLVNLGINKQSIKPPEKKWGALRYSDLMIGNTGDNSIDTITLTYAPTAILTHKLQSIVINGAYLSGDIDINGITTIKGLESLPSRKTIRSINTEKINFKNINFSILSAHFGGLRGVLNIDGQRDNDAMIWTGNIDSRQDQLELIAKINAQTNESGRWIADIEIENAKLERSFGKFTRVNGAISYTGNENTWQTVKAELSAGGFVAYDTSWQNASVALNGTPKSTKSFITGKSSGVEGVELTIESILSMKDISWSASIYGETGKDLLTYFKSHDMLPFAQDELKSIGARENVTIQIKPNNNGLIFKIKDDPQSIVINGKIDKKSNTDYSVTTASTSNIITSINGSKCTKKKASESHICRMELTRENGHYALKD